MPNQYYTFLSHIRQGIAKEIQNSDDDISGSPTVRPEVSVQFDLKGNQVGGTDNHLIESVSKNVKLYGPGDIVGINPDAVHRTAPLDWITNFEYNFLPYIEFLEEDFPWRYSPSKPYGSSANEKKIKPWMALVVLKEDEFEKVDNQNGKSPSFKTKKPQNEIFPIHDQLWAWAHVHVNHDFNQAQISNSIETLDELLKTNPSIAVSRIICPRKLEKDTAYYAFLIPAYEHGRRAGLGISLDLNHKSLTPSWDETDDTTKDIEFPIYYEWYFKTSEHGDFESLVEDMKPIVLEGDSMGFRKVDIQDPGDSNFFEVDPLESPTIDLGGVLRTLDYDPTEDDSWPVTDIEPDSYLELLKEKINYAYEIQHAEPNGDPIVSPPLYGRWHAKKEKIEDEPDDDWFTRANLDPRFRIFASAGTEVVKKNQEAFMEACWIQLDKVNEANKILRQLQLAERASTSIYENSVANQSVDRTLLLTSSLHDLVIDQGHTVHYQIDESYIPNELMSGAFRKMVRINGSFANALNTNTMEFSLENLVSNINNQVVVVASDYAAPTGVYYMPTTVQNTIDQVWITSQPARNDFYLTNPSNVFYNPGMGLNHTMEAYNFMTASLNTIGSLSMVYANPGFGTSIDLSGSATAVVAQLEPTVTIQAIASGRVVRINSSGQSVAVSSLNEILATPKIEYPMSKFLYEYSPDLLVPGINSIPQNSVSTLGIDQRYVEAFMLGLNHEMMRELLWRGYPTDQRGTVFSRFWGSAISPFAEVNESDKARVIKNIHQWGTNSLGNNYPSNGSDPNSLIILVVRAELIKKYPNTFIYAHKAEFELDSQAIPDLYEIRKLSEQYDSVKKPVFITQMADLTFFGFEIDPEEAKGNLVETTENPLAPGWFFVFKEMVGEINFGLDAKLEEAPFENEYESWNNVDWISIESEFIDVISNITSPEAPIEGIQSVVWGRNSSEMTYIVYRKPSLVAYHSINLIP